MGKDGKQHTVWVNPNKPQQSQKQLRKLEAEQRHTQSTRDKLKNKKQKRDEESAKKEKTVAGKVGKWKKQQEAQYDQGKGGSLLKKKMKGVVTSLKNEVKEWKHAGVGIKKLVSGDKLEKHEIRAIKSVATHVAIMVAIGVVSHGAAALAAKHIVVGYLEHAGITRLGHAPLFAKAEGAAGEADITDEEAEVMMKRLVAGMSDYLIQEGKNGDNTGQANEQNEQEG